MIIEDFEDGDLEAELFIELDPSEVEAIKQSMSEQEHIESQYIMEGGECDALGLETCGADCSEGHEDNGEAEDSPGGGVSDGEDHLVFDTSRRLEDMWRREPTDRSSRFRPKR